MASSTSDTEGNFVYGKHVIFVNRPGVVGEPKESDFQVETLANVQDSALPPNSCLVRTLYLSMDPALRCRMNESTGVNYMEAWQLSETVTGLGGVGVVEKSSAPSFPEGCLVQGFINWPWAQHFVWPSQDLIQLSVEECRTQPGLALSCYGVTGLTAALGLTTHPLFLPPHPPPSSLVVSAAAGATGHLVGQIAKILGCATVIGIAGTAEKCSLLTSELAFDHAICYRTDDVDAKLEGFCPDGVQLYLDNTGGPISEAVMRKMQAGGSIILCGQIAHYNTEEEYPPPLSQEAQKLLKVKQISRKRFLVVDHEKEFASAITQLAQWRAQGSLKVKDTVFEGIEQAPAAFVSMMRGGNIGKQLVRVSEL